MNIDYCELKAYISSFSTFSYFIVENDRSVTYKPPSFLPTITFNAHENCK